MASLADLIRMGKQYVADALPGGSLNKEVTQNSLRNAAELASMMPNPVGDIASGGLALSDLINGDYGGAALNGVGLLPFVPAMGGMIKTTVGRIPETAKDTEQLAGMLQRAGEKSGYIVNRSDSAVSPSRYVSFAKAGDEAGDTVRQVRLSNHADKYPELASGIRSSVDPSTEISFEQAVNWLAREGFPTSLSKKFKETPTWEQVYEARRIADAMPEVRLQKLQAAWLNQPKATRGPRPTIESMKDLIPK